MLARPGVITPTAVEGEELIVHCRYTQSAIGSTLRFYGVVVAYEVDWAD